MFLTEGDILHFILNVLFSLGEKQGYLLSVIHVVESFQTFWSHYPLSLLLLRTPVIMCLPIFATLEINSEKVLNVY